MRIVLTGLEIIKIIENLDLSVLKDLEGPTCTCCTYGDCGARDRLEICRENAPRVELVVEI
jgi:hypothetical protein